MKIRGIYEIKNLINDEIYIGSSSNIAQRWANHKSPSQWAAHPCWLYEAFKDYGIENFSFSVLEEITDETINIKEVEDFYIKQLLPKYNKNSAFLDLEDYKAKKDAARTKRNKELCIYNGRKYQLNSLYHKLKKEGVNDAWKVATNYLMEK